MLERLDETSCLNIQQLHFEIKEMYVSPRLYIPQRKVTIISRCRKSLSIWRYCKRYNSSHIFVASITESIVSTSHISIAILLPDLRHKVYYFTHE